MAESFFVAGINFGIPVPLFCGQSNCMSYLSRHEALPDEEFPLLL